MKTQMFRSCLAQQIASFISLRQLSGTDYGSQAWLLGSFDRFLAEQNLQQPRIIEEICDQYRQHIGHLTPRSRNNRLCVVRQLCRYLSRTDPLSYIPEPIRTLPSWQARRAYIFNPQQVSALLAAATALPPPGSLRPDTYRTLLGLLYSTGIRIGEALALNIEHFLPNEQRLYIANGKFHKSRWIALSASTSRELERYLIRRTDLKPNAPDAPLLLNMRRQRFCHPTISPVFRKLLHVCGISWSRSTGPRIHDLRHTFAVHRLLSWYRNGADVNALLPVLATHMGHINISSTQIYLQPTAELLGEVSRRFHDYYLKQFAPKGSTS